MKQKEIDKKYGNGIELHYDHKLIPDGYAWIFPGKKILNVGIGTMRNHCLNLRDRLDAFLKMREIRGKKGSVMGGMIPARGPYNKTVSGNMLLVGDAAGQTGPLFGEGISYAVANAQFAAQACIDYFSKNAPLETYQKLWKRHFWAAYFVEKVMQRGFFMCERLKLTPYVFSLAKLKPINYACQLWAEGCR